MGRAGAVLLSRCPSIAGSAVAGLLVALVLVPGPGCSEPAAPEAIADAEGPGATPAEAGERRPRPDLLWSFNLSDDAVGRMTAGDLWEIGVECLAWSEEVPEGISKATVRERLMAAKYRDVGDYLGGDDSWESGYD